MSVRWDKSAGFGERSWRYSAYIDDTKIVKMFKEVRLLHICYRIILNLLTDYFGFRTKEKLKMMQKYLRVISSYQMANTCSTFYMNISHVPNHISRHLNSTSKTTSERIAHPTAEASFACKAVQLRTTILYLNCSIGYI